MPTYAFNSFRLCIDVIDGNHWSGRVYTLLADKKIKFDDLTDMVLLVDNIFDQNDYPKAYQLKRSFTTKKQTAISGILEAKYDASLLLTKKGQLNTYDIIVTSRQHTTWQGLIKDLDGNIIDYFNSDLKLIEILMESNM